MKTITRTLSAKAISYTISERYRKGKYSDWDPTYIDVLLRTILRQSPTIGERHYPEITKVKEGSQCLFINSWKDLGGNGILFNVCAYTEGLTPETIIKDYKQSEVDLQAIDLKRSTTTNEELVFHYRCIALGQTLIIEQVNGSSGSTGLKRLLNSLAKKHIDKTHPVLDFNDFTSKELRDLIKLKGGVEKITARLVDTAANPGSKFGTSLSRVTEAVPGANKCVIRWESDKSNELDTETSIQLFEEVHDSNVLEGVTLHFKFGGSVGDISSYTEKKSVDVQKLQSGLPAINEIEDALKNYLADLRNPTNKTPINTNGTVKAVDFIKVKK